MATTVRLPKDIENKLSEISKLEKLSKSEVIKISLKEYFKKYYNTKTPFELGKELFGKYSGNSDLSTNRKEYFKKKLNEKISN